MLSGEEKLSRLRSLYDLSQGSDDFEGGVSFQEEMEALLVGNWAILAYDDIDDLALSFHVDSHPSPWPSSPGSWSSTTCPSSSTRPSRSMTGTRSSSSPICLLQSSPSAE